MRRILRPFLKAVHPDILHEAPSAARKINEQSLQHLNTVVDSLEHIRKSGEKGGPMGRVESQYDLSFFYRKEGHPPSLGNFNARLLFPHTAISRLQRSSGQARTSRAKGSTSTKESEPQWPTEISSQFRKLFEGAELPLPPELEGAAGKAEGLGKGFQPMSKEQARRMMRADLFKRQGYMRVDGYNTVLTPEDWDKVIDRFMRSGRVLTRGRFTVSEELNALAELKMLLCEEAEELEFNEPGVMNRFIFVIDKDHVGEATYEPTDEMSYTISIPYVYMKKCKVEPILRRIAAAARRERHAQFLRRN